MWNSKCFFFKFGNPAHPHSTYTISSQFIHHFLDENFMWIIIIISYFLLLPLCELCDLTSWYEEYINKNFWIMDTWIFLETLFLFNFWHYIDLLFMDVSIRMRKWIFFGRLEEFFVILMHSRGRGSKNPLDGKFSTTF